MFRRNLLAALSAGAVGVIAGCIGSEVDELQNGDGGADDDADDANDEEDAPTFGDVNLDDQYEVTFDIEHAELGYHLEGSGRAHGQNHYYQADMSNDQLKTIEAYLVDEVGYLIVDDECYRVDEKPQDVFDPNDVDREQYDDREPDEITEIDGHEMYVYRFTEPELADHDVTLYVDTETNYPRRVEIPDHGVVAFSSWGDTEPIEAPDMECTDATPPLPDDLTEY